MANYTRNPAVVSAIQLDGTYSQAAILIDDNPDEVSIQDDFQIVKVTALANTSGGLNGKYFLISSNAVDYYVWFSTNGTGSDPAVAGRTGINVNLAAGNSTASQVAAKIRDVLNAYSTSSVFTVVALNALATVTMKVTGGAKTAAGAGNSGFTVTTDNPGEIILNIVTDLGIASAYPTNYLLTAPEWAVMLEADFEAEYTEE